MNKIVTVLIRVNPDIDPIVHPHISTGLRSSKFGVVEEDVAYLADRIFQSGIGSSLKKGELFQF